MKHLFNLLFVFVVISLVAGCGKKPEPTEVKKLDTYTDNILKFSIKYPSNWYTFQRYGKGIVIFTTKDAMKRFYNYDAVGNPGAKIDLSSMPMDTINMDKVVETFKQFQKEVYSAPEKLTIDGVPATKYSYTFELDDGKFNGEIYFAAKDPKMATILIYEAFAGTFDSYRKTFDEILSSLKLAQTPSEKPDTITVTEEQPPPSSTFITKGGNGFSISIPDNFVKERGKSNGVITSENFIGMRRADCNILVDVIDASKQNNLKKIVDENKASYGNANPRDISLGGLKGYMLSYSFGRNVQSRVYFVMKGEKLYRITMNWFKGEQKDYLPAFEKSIQSIKFE